MNRVPCGRNEGHGLSCAKGSLCSACEEIVRLRGLVAAGAMTLASGYWIISGPLPVGGKPVWPAPWRAQFMPSGGGHPMGWGATLEEACADAMAKAVLSETS